MMSLLFVLASRACTPPLASWVLHLLFSCAPPDKVQLQSGVWISACTVKEHKHRNSIKPSRWSIFISTVGLVNNSRSTTLFCWLMRTFMTIALASLKLPATCHALALSVVPTSAKWDLNEDPTVQDICCCICRVDLGQHFWPLELGHH